MRKITASTLGEECLSSKVVMSHTRRKSATSLVHYDSTDLAKATKAAHSLQLSEASKSLPTTERKMENNSDIKSKELYRDVRKVQTHQL